MKREILRCQNVTTSEQGMIFLKDFNLSVFEDECLALLVVDSHGVQAFLQLLAKGGRLDYGRIFYMEKERYSYRRDQTVIIPVIQAGSGIVDDLTVLDNLYVLRDDFQERLIDKRKLNRRFEQLRQELALDFTGDTVVKQLSELNKQRVELIKAVEKGRRLIVINQLVGTMSSDEVVVFQQLIDYYRKKGISFIYICHHHEEAEKIADRIAIFKKGMISKVISRRDFGRQIFSKIYEAVYEDIGIHQIELGEKEIFRFEGVDTGAVKSFNLVIKERECVTVWDRDNQAVADLLAILSGKVGMNQGKLYLEGAPLPANLANQVRQGMVIVKELDQMIFKELSYQDNLGMLLYNKKMDISFVKLRKYLQNKKVRRPIPDDYQAKVDLVYQRIALARPKIVFFVQPFGKADMFVRRRIIDWLTKLKSQGAALVILTRNLSDSLMVSDGLVVIERDGSQQFYRHQEFRRFGQQATILSKK